MNIDEPILIHQLAIKNRLVLPQEQRANMTGIGRILLKNPQALHLSNEAKD